MGLGTALLLKTEICSACPAGVNTGDHTHGGEVVSDFSRRRGMFTLGLHGKNYILDQNRGTQREPSVRCCLKAEMSCSLSALSLCQKHHES